MKHSQETIDKVKLLLDKGASSREIANYLHIGKSTVNDLRKQFEKDMKDPWILLLDLETSAALVYTFGRFNVNFSQDHVKEEGGKILVASWKWLHEPHVHSIYMTPKQIRKGDDKKVTEKLYRLYAKADAIVAHNAKRFDHKVIQTRGVLHGLGVLPTVKVLDTYEVAKKKLKLPSNSLDSIAAYFNVGRKSDSGGISAWAAVQEGDTRAMQNMVQYCQDDVALLQEVFMGLHRLGFVGFNVGLYYDDSKEHCPSCGSTHVTATGRFVYSSTSKYEEMHCNDCGGISRRKVNLLSKEKRQNTLVR